MEYPAEVRKLSKTDGGGFSITFPDLPGCMSDGDTVEEAFKNGADAVKDWIKARKKVWQGHPSAITFARPGRLQRQIYPARAEKCSRRTGETRRAGRRLNEPTGAELSCRWAGSRR